MGKALANAPLPASLPSPRPPLLPFPPHGYGPDHLILANFGSDLPWAGVSTQKDEQINRSCLDSRDQGDPICG